MVRIAKVPFIQEDTDRWGRPQGTFSVVNIQGDMDDEMWGRVQEYEGYYLSEQGQAETKALDEATVSSIHGVVDKIREMVPYMNKLIGYCNSQLWQFNLRVSQTPYRDVAFYIRSYAIFGEKTHYEWTPEHDEKVKLLKEQAANMNNKSK